MIQEFALSHLMCVRVGAAGKETILVIEQRKLSVLKEEVRNELI